jgi:hypothetical protein
MPAGEAPALPELSSRRGFLQVLGLAGIGGLTASCIPGPGSAPPYNPGTPLDWATTGLIRTGRSPRT